MNIFLIIISYASKNINFHQHNVLLFLLFLLDYLPLASSYDILTWESLSLESPFYFQKIFDMVKLEDLMRYYLIVARLDAMSYFHYNLCSYYLHCYYSLATDIASKFFFYYQYTSNHSHFSSTFHYF